MFGRNKSTRATTASRDTIGNAARSPFGRLAKQAGLLATLGIAGLLFGVSLPATAVPPSTPQADRVFADCTFDIGLLRDALTIPPPSLNKLVGDQVRASYILIYVRANPNDGQPLDNPSGSFTGPVLCISDTETIDQTTETTDIPDGVHPDADSVDLLDTEEAFHLRYQVNGGAADGDFEKRVCHTVAGNTDCFFIQP